MDIQPFELEYPLCAEMRTVSSNPVRKRILKRLVGPEHMMTAVPNSDDSLTVAMDIVPLNVLLIEPTPPDQRWMELMLAETGIPHTLRVFATAALALHVLRQEAGRMFDIVIV